jgi:ribosomal protein S18 acetylase RimI-like enzyme
MACEGIVRLRRATTDDAAAIARVHVETWRDAYRGQLPQAFLDALDPSVRAVFWRDTIAAATPDRCPWVAYVRSAIAGFISVGPSRDDDADTAMGEVYAIYVNPPCWGRGVGRQLMAHGQRDLRSHGYGTATLWVLAGNERAIRFYEADGWRRDGGERTATMAGVGVAEVRYRRTLG